MFKNKLPVSGKKGIIYLILGTLAVKWLSSFVKKKEPELGHNFRKFLHKEKNEIKKFSDGKESFGKYCQDSCSLFMDYFIPHECNGHKPKILRTKSLAIIAAILITAKLVMGAYLFLVYPNQAHMSEEVVNRVLVLVNEERKAQGLNELTMNSALNTYALAKANDMLDKDYFAHYSPDGKKPWDFIDRNQYKYVFVGENLAMNFTNADSVHMALMNSESHKHNILNERYNDVGLAMVTGVINGKTTNILVQFFATQNPLNLAAKTSEVKTAGTNEVAVVPKAAPVVEVKTVVKAPQVKQAVAVKPAPVEVKPKVVEAPKVEASKVETPAPVVEKPASEKLAETPVAPKPPVVENEPVQDLTAELASAQSVNKTLNESSEAVQPKLERKYAPGYEEGDIEGRDINLMAPEEQDPVLFKANTSPNTEIDNFKMIEVKSFANIDETFALTATIVKIVRYGLITILALVCLALIVNIVVKIEVQHHSVIFQTLFLLVLISGLLFMRTHFMESAVTDLLIV